VKVLENNQKTWLWDSAEEIVDMLQGCCSLQMFEKLKDMILSSWRAAGEQGMVLMRSKGGLRLMVSRKVTLLS
jgi:hypothetical protein